MAADPDPFLASLAAAIAQWRRRGRLADLLPALLDLGLLRCGAERAICFTEREDGGYLVHGSRDTDGEPLPDAEGWISNFAVMRAAGRQDPLLFPDTRADRRYRTEAERERGVRSRSILIVPVPVSDPPSMLYFDSRFRVIEAPSDDDPEWAVLGELLAVGVEGERERLARRELERRLRTAERRASVAPRAVKPAPARIPRSLEEPIEFHGFLTRSGELVESIGELRRLAASPVPVLIEGESGTGKELLARAIHAESARTGPFVTLHCSTIPETLVEVELFGHLAGAFTGAERDRAGLLAHAEGGTLFLDAIEEASPILQAALLRVLEVGTYRPLASDDEVTADVRVISSTLEGDTPEGTDDDVRLDLYYRLAGARVRIPPLRDRREDILPIARRLLERAAENAPPPVIDDEARTALLAHDWPGNAREIENLARRIIALGETTLTAERFHAILGRAPAASPLEGEMRHVVDRAEREVILRALSEAAGNKSVACRLLGMSRRTLYRRMQKHGIPL